MQVEILGRIRKLLEGIDASAVDNEQQLAMTQQLELLVALGASPWGELVRMGRSFFSGNTGAGVAAVVALPTTAVMFALFNNDGDTGRSLVIDWVAASGVAKTAAAGQAQLLGLLGQGRETAPADSGVRINKANGNAAAGNDTKARTIVAGTALPAGTGIAANWIPLGPAVGFPGAAATPGLGLWAAIDGRLIVAPGRYFAMHVLADVVGSTFLGFIGWHERLLTLG